MALENDSMLLGNHNRRGKIVTTQDMIQTALELAGLDQLPWDSQIITESQDVKRVLFGIDMETQELLLAKNLGFDCVVSHHPHAGRAMLDFSKVMEVQIDKMVSFGVPINRAQKALKKKQLSVDIGMHVSNYDRTASAAKLLGMSYFNVHMPADLITEGLVQKELDHAFLDQPKVTLGEIMTFLNGMEAYANAPSGPVIRVGSDNDYAVKIAVLMAGGTNGGTEVYKAYFDAGVGTIIAMHMPEDVKKAVEEQGYGNVIIAGHMASDSIGLRVIADAWRSQGIEVVTMSGILELQ
jgi:putative NIF3 family GTP cyclohydrolase 1 type 2